MTLGRIAHYPPVFQSQIRRVLTGSTQEQYRCARQGYHLLTDETKRLESLSSEEPVWASASLAPCLFIGALITNGQGRFQEARAGHFSTRFLPSEIRSFLSNPSVPANATKVWVAGLAQKSSPISLKETTVRLVGAINDSGIPLTIQWENEERPLLTDPRTSEIVSDLGLGVQYRDKPFSTLGRIVSFGVTSSHAAMISRISATAGGPPLQLMLFTATA